ncbi:unnamed protein product [Sphenostylis stenocarpa]|uniref:BHLH domain-containing protein n=1 Tax=Sphenostylis stenocarpa TaxID=92480 RepID=A0AA86V9Y0_9FABA|nr:unnamed protein product [Sphenostylis stenocarpa]
MDEYEKYRQEYEVARESMVSFTYHDDLLELVWEDGDVVVRGGSSNRSQRTNEDRVCEGASIRKRTRLNPLYSLEDHFPLLKESDTSSSHQSNGQDSRESSQTKNSCKLNEEFENLLRPVKDSKPVTPGYSLLQQRLPSSPLEKHRTDSTQTPPPANTRNMGFDQRTAKVNFSNFSIPAVFVKSITCKGNSATQQAKYHSSPAKVEEIEARKVEKSAEESQVLRKQTSLTVERSANPPPPLDEHSEAVGLGIHRYQGQLPCDQTPVSEAHKEKEKAYNNNKNNNTVCREPFLASSSVCSLGASNYPNLGIRKHEDTDDSNDEEPEDTLKQDREGSRVKRSRNPEVHNLSEKKRREKINKKMRTLKELIPNCNKVDKASMLDDAIDYLKTLKLQLQCYVYEMMQMMSMGNGLWPLMMLPAAAAHHMNGPYLPQLVGAGMGFRPPQVPMPPLSAITDNICRQMFGFPNQTPPMPMPHAPFFPIIGNSPTRPHLATTTTPTTDLAQRLAKSAASVSLPNIMDPLENATQLQNQVSFQHRGTSTPLATPFIFSPK